MLSSLRYSLPAFLAVAFAETLAFADLTAVRLNPNEQQLLATMDAELVAECLAVARDLEGFRRDVDAARRAIAQASTENIFDDSPATDQAARIFAIAESLSKRSQRFRDWIHFDDLIGKVLRDVEQRIRAAVYDPVLHSDLGEDDFRGLVRDVARAQAVARMLQGDLMKVLDLVNSAKNPAQYARSFLEEEIKKKYFNRPYEVGDVRVSLAQQDFRRSLFSKDANVQVKLDYGEFGSFAVSGVYFAYSDGKLPMPMFDRVSSQGPDLTSLANKQLSKLGDAIPDVGLGIKLKPKFLGFGPDKRKRRCGIQCAATVDGSKLLDFIPGVRFIPKGTFTLYPSAPFIVKDDFSAIIEGGNKTVRLQLGTTPLELRGYWISIDPRAKGAEKFLSIKTNLGPSAGASEAVSFEITISCGMPVKGFAFDGKLKIGDTVTIGTVDGKITPKEFSGNFSIPPREGSVLPIKDLINAKGSFRFDRDGLAGNCLATFYQAFHAKSHLLLRPDCSGRFDFDEGADICGVHASGSVEGTFEKRFKNLQVVASLMVTVDGLESFGFARASVTTTIHDLKTVHVQASALGTFLEFDMDRNGNLVDELRKRLRDAVPRGVQVLLDGAKDLDAFNRNSALRRGLVELDVFNKNSEAAKLLGGLRDVRNDLLNDIPGASEAGKSIQRLGDGASETVNKIFGVFHDDDHRLLNPLRLPPAKRPVDLYRELLPYQLTGLITIEASAAQNPPINVQSNAFLTKLQQLNFHEQPRLERHSSGARRYAKKTELSVKCDRATLAPQGDNDIIIALSLRCSGYWAQIGGPGGSKRRQGAEIKWATILLKNARGKAPGPPSIVINLPNLNQNQKYTYLDVQTLVRTRLQRLVEQYLPNYAVAGPQRFYEKRLAIRNAGVEPITVWMECRAFTRDAKGYAWRWLPGEPGSGKAFKLVVPPGGTKKLEEELTVKLPKISAGSFLKGAKLNVASSSTAVSVPFEASRIRIWAESQGGARQTNHRDRDFWLVPENSQFNRERVYVADKMQSATYTFTFPNRMRTFSERLVSLKNETHEYLTVSNLRYRTTKNGKAVWQSLPRIELQPGEVNRLKQSDGSYIRASQLCFLAEGQQVLFDQHRNEPLNLVRAENGVRLYREDTIGAYVHVFRNPAGPSKSHLK